MRLAKRICPAATPAGSRVGNVQCVLLKESLWITANVSKSVAGTNRLVFMRATRPATGQSHVLHAACHARFSVPIRSARDYVQSPALHARYRHVSQRVHTASVLCHVLLHVTIYLARFDARNGLLVATSARRFVERLALHLSSVKSAPALSSRSVLSTSFWLRRMPKLTSTRTRVSSLAAVTF